MRKMAFHLDETCIHEYVTFVTRVQQMLMFTFKSTLRFMSVFLLEGVTSVPSILGS